MLEKRETRKVLHCFVPRRSARRIILNHELDFTTALSSEYGPSTTAICRGFDHERLSAFDAAEWECTVPVIHKRNRSSKLFFRRFSCEQGFFAQYVEGRGVGLFQLACKQDTEDIVAKRKTGIYAVGECGFKMKNETTRR
jgi:hypothetical protein